MTCLSADPDCGYDVVVIYERRSVRLDGIFYLKIQYREADWEDCRHLAKIVGDGLQSGSGAI